MEKCIETSCCSSEKECCKKSCCDDGNMDKSKMMMNLANDAWEELMKEKIKTAYEKVIGDKMSKAAAVSAEACIAYWNSKMKEEAACAEFEDKLGKAMM